MTMSDGLGLRVKPKGFIAHPLDSKGNLIETGSDGEKIEQRVSFAADNMRPAIIFRAQRVKDQEAMDKELAALQNVNDSTSNHVQEEKDIFFGAHYTCASSKSLRIPKNHIMGCIRVDDSKDFVHLRLMLSYPVQS